MSQIPLKNLSNIENKLDFWLSQGWAVDLKNPDVSNYKDITKYIMNSYGIDIEDSEQDKYFPPQKLNLSYVKKICRQVKTLELLIAGKKLSHTELLDILTTNRDKLVSGQFSEDELKAANFPTFETVPWGMWAFFVPKGEANTVNSTASNIAEKMQEFDIRGGFNLAFVKEYHADDLKSASLEIFKNCQGARIDGVFIISPPSIMHEEAIHRQFCNDIEHMLNSIDICVSCVDIDKLRLPSSTLQAIGDLASCK
jgi:hypothetical protein